MATDGKSHYRYEQLRYSQFFPVELAWWRMRLPAPPARWAGSPLGAATVDRLS